jgi:SAM-dependent methyltransferase
LRSWQSFFDSQAERYEENGFTAHTAAEIDFFLSLFAISPGATVLDMGCGTGRHSIELAKRGYRPTGVDLSMGMLSVARRNAISEGQEIEWIQADATSWKTDSRFDAALCLCEGGVGLIDPGENVEQHDHSIFSNVANALKPNAPFLLTTLNGYSIIRQMSDEHIAGGRFNPANMYATYQDEWDLPEGNTLMNIHERLFIPPEMVKLLAAAGFIVDNVYGGTAGHWARRFLSLDEVEAMYVCRKR